MAIYYEDAYPASVLSTIAETYNITSGSNDKLSITIDGGSPQVFTLTAGAARTAAQIAADLVGLTGAAAAALYSHVLITGSAAGSGKSIVFNTTANDASATLGFTLAQTFPSQSRQNSTFTGANKQNIIDGIETVLLAAGWQTVSGHATTNLLIQSQVSPDSTCMRLRVKDNGNTCTVCSLENVQGTKVGNSSTTAGCQLLPAAAKVFRVIAHKFGGYIFTAVTTACREFACWGLPKIRTDLVGTITDSIFMHGNAANDTDVTVRASFRTKLNANADTIGPGNAQQIRNSSIWEIASDINIFAGTQLLQPMNSFGQFTNLPGYRWSDDAADAYDAKIAWGATAKTDEAKYQGYVYDALATTEAYTGDHTGTFDSHNIWILTNSNTGSNSTPRGSLVLVVP